MAKGAESKKIVINKILEVFENAFEVDAGKEIRIPFEEDGNNLQIKLVLTTAKTNIGSPVYKSTTEISTPVVNKKISGELKPPKEGEYERILQFLNEMEI